MESSPQVQESPIDPTLVSKVVRIVSRQHRLSREDAADLESNVWIKLLRHEHRALRSFADQCPLFHYLRVVATRVLLDMRTASLGKWRPTAAARRAGLAVVELERLVHRDGVMADAAVHSVACATGVDAACLEGHLERGGPRRRPRAVSLDETVSARLPAVLAEPDAPVLARDRGVVGRRSGQALRDALRALPDDDRRLLRLRYYERMRIVDIARLLSIDPKSLYRRFEGLHARLREDLSGAGVSRSGAADIVGRSEIYVTSVFGARR